MGYMRHELIYVATVYSRIDSPRRSCPDLYAKFTAKVNELRAAMPEAYRALLVGPIPHVCNGTESWAFFPDGSKEDWAESDEGDRWRHQFRTALELLEWTNPITVFSGDDGVKVLVEAEEE